VDMSKADLSCPSGVPQRLWDTLRKSYNHSQLFAIKYVSDQADLKSLDTKIALIQGPPGTGKTSTVGVRGFGFTGYVVVF
jgi:Cdc6-like AAA superfamily ATPase